jgi:hypothetical protein
MPPVRKDKRPPSSSKSAKKYICTCGSSWKTEWARARHIGQFPEDSEGSKGLIAEVSIEVTFAYFGSRLSRIPGMLALQVAFRGRDVIVERGARFERAFPRTPETLGTLGILGKLSYVSGSGPLCFP